MQRSLPFESISTTGSTEDVEENKAFIVRPEAQEDKAEVDALLKLPKNESPSTEVVAALSQLGSGSKADDDEMQCEAVQVPNAAMAHVSSIIRKTAFDEVQTVITMS